MGSSPGSFVGAFFHQESGNRGMSNTSKYLIFGSMAASGVVAAASLMDIFTKKPFAGQTMMDIMFLVGAGIVIYMGWDAYQESK
jgi:hypothetical protein